MGILRRRTAMSQAQVEVQGTLRDDGTLLLDETPKLPPGRVRVLVQALPAKGPPTETLLEFVERSRRELAAAGSHFMNEHEVDAHVELLREGDAIDELLRHADEQHQRREQP
jgi:hypothetical protein